MYSWQDPEDRIPILQMNSDLRHAELELLSAHCATYQLRLRYTTDDLARYGRRDLLRKSVEAAKSLSAFYISIEEKIPQGEAGAAEVTLSEEQVLEAIELVSAYLSQQRELYFASSKALSPELQAIMWPYFSPALLDQVRIVQLDGERVAPPSFYAAARALGFVNLPEIAHMNSVTFLDVLVFNETLSERSLFHALVHTVQFQVLGAFSLESSFCQPAGQRFSVEEQVRLWAKQGRYKALRCAAHP